MASNALPSVPTTAAEDGAALVGFVRSLTDASTLEELGCAFRVRFGRVMSAPMFGFYALDADKRQIEHTVSINVSDVFVARYVQSMHLDPLLARSRETGQVVYNRALMSEAEWAESEIYRHAYATHAMRQVVEAPIMDGPEVLGALHFARTEADQSVSSSELEMAETIASVLAISIKQIHGRETRDRALEEALAALQLTGTAIVVSEPPASELRLNPAAKSLVAEVVAGEERLPRLLVPRPEGGRFSRRTDVELKTGERASLHAHSRPIRGTVLVTVLELKREHPLVDRAHCRVLTAREADVAMLVVEGLGDREIAEQLCLSPYTVHQYVKRIYRSLDVDSRVALTRLLLGVPVRGRRDPHP